MPIHLLIKLLAGLFTIWLGLIWSGNLPHPTWLKDDIEPLLTIPAALLWVIGWWEEVEGFFRKKLGAETPPAVPPNVQVTVQNILPQPSVPLPNPASPTDAPMTNAPMTNGPMTNDPMTNGPMTNAPMTNAPMTNAPMTNGPMTNDPMTNGPMTNDPMTNGPMTNAPMTNAPMTNAPMTNGPMTNDPMTNAPMTNDPMTNDPMTNDPMTNGPMTNGPMTNAPMTNAPMTNAPMTTVTLGNRLIQGPDDPILSPLLGKPLHGRTEDIARLCHLLAHSDTDLQVVHPLVTAEGGVGKTELCKAALRQHLRTHPYRKVWFVHLEGASDIGDLWQRMAQAIGLDNLRSEAELMAALPEGIFYLDNLESLLAVPRLSERLRQLSLRPGLRLLASSRYEVPGWGKAFDLSTLSLPAATALFREVWADTDALPLPDPSPALDGFVTEHLGCLPLAVVLVAALGRYEGSLEAVMRRWHEEGAAAAQRTGAAPDSRLDSLEHSIRLSLHHLPPPARLLWAIAAFFPEGMPSDYLQELLRSEPDLRAGRDQLLLHRILHRQPDGRLRLSPPLARFAKDRLGDFSDTPAEVFSRIAPWLKALGDAADSDRDGRAIARLFDEFATMESLSVFFAQQPAQPQGFMPLLRAWQNCYWRRIFLGKKILAAALGCAKNLPDRDHAWVLEYAGDLALGLGENAESRARYDAALPLYEKVGSDLGKANTLISLGDLALRLGENAESRARYDAALPLYEKVGDDLGKANTLLSLGELALRLGEHAESRARFEAALPLYEKVGDDLGKANTLQSLGDLEQAEGNSAAAEAQFAAALALYQKVSEPMGMGYCHVELGRAAHTAGRSDEAREHLRHALACSDKVGNPHLAGRVKALEQEIGG